MKIQFTSLIKSVKKYKHGCLFIDRNSSCLNISYVNRTQKLQDHLSQRNKTIESKWGKETNHHENKQTSCSLHCKMMGTYC